MVISTNNSIYRKDKETKADVLDLNRINGCKMVELCEYDVLKKLVTTSTQVYAEFDLTSEVSKTDRNKLKFLAMHEIVVDVETKEVFDKKDGVLKFKQQSSIEEIQMTSLYKKYSSFIYTSKSHRKGINGDCFHWIIPLRVPIESYEKAKIVCGEIKKCLDREEIVYDLCNVIQGYNPTLLNSDDDEKRFQLIVEDRGVEFDAMTWVYTKKYFDPGYQWSTSEYTSDDGIGYRINRQNYRLHTLLMEDYRRYGRDGFAYRVTRQIALDIREVQTRFKCREDCGNLLTYSQWHFIMGVFKKNFSNRDDGLMLAVLMSKGYRKNGKLDTVREIYDTYNKIEFDSPRYLTALLRTYRIFMAHNPTKNKYGKRVSKFGRVTGMIRKWLEENGFDDIAEDLLFDGYDDVYYCSSSDRAWKFRNSKSEVSSKDIRKKTSKLADLPEIFVGSGNVKEFRKKKTITYDELAEIIIREVDQILLGYKTIFKSEVIRIIKDVRDQYISKERARNQVVLKQKNLISRLTSIGCQVPN